MGLTLLSVVVGASVITQLATDSARKRISAALRVERSITALKEGLREENTTLRRRLTELRQNVVAAEGDQTALATLETLIYRRLGSSDKLSEAQAEELNRFIDAALNQLRNSEQLAVNDRRRRVSRLGTVTTVLLALGLLGLAYVFYNIYNQLRPLISELNSAIATRDREIRERQRVQQLNNELIRSLNLRNEDLDHFAYLASHDLQEPLRTVNNFVDLFEEEYADRFDDKGKAYLGYIKRGSERMRQLITGLLQYSQIGRQGSPAWVDLEQVLAEVHQNLDLLIQENKAEIIIDPLPTVRGHALELGQLFQNLISNAIKFTEPGQSPCIKITCQEEEQEYVIAVSDHGIGMTVEDQKKIFKVFTRLNNQQAYNGQGIGLAFCRKIVELHYGSITVESTKGVGSTFFVRLPSTVEHEAPISQRSPDR